MIEITEILGITRAVLNSGAAEDLRSKKYKGRFPYIKGHCYVASEALFHLLKQELPSLKPYFIRHEGEPHWFLKEELSNIVIDITRSQFKTPVPYSEAIKKGFLTKDPSKRAAKLMYRLGYE